MKNKSVVFKLSIKFSAILTAAVILIILIFFMLLRSFGHKQEIRAFKRTINSITHIIETGAPEQLDKRLSELPFFISYIIYDSHSQEIIRKKFEKTSILPLSPKRPRHLSGKSSYTTRDVNIVYMTADCNTPSGRKLTVQITTNDNNDPGNSFISQMLLLIAAAAVPILVISYLLSLYITKQTIKPVVEITKAAKSISSEKLDQRLPQTGKKDELDNLASTFNELFSKLKNDFDQERSFTSNVSHELKTPVAVILGQANLLRRWGKNDPAQLDKSLDTILQETRSMESIITNLLQLSRLETGKIEPHKEEVDLTAIFLRLEEEFHSVNPSIQFNFDKASENILITDSELLHQVFVAIISNSCKFKKADLSIELRCNKTDNSVTIEIEDNGPGFEENIIPHVFERFYRGDSSHNRAAGGSGLGLSISQAIVHSLNGTISASNSKNGGALLTICLRG